MNIQKAEQSVDPNVKIPTAVKKVADRAAELHNNYLKTKGNEPPAPAPTSEPTPVPPIEASPAPAPEPAPITTEGNQPPASAPVPAEEWERRFKAMKGRFDRSEETVRTQKEQLRSQDERITSLEQLLADRAVAPQEGPKLISAAEESEYGSELLAVVGKKAQETVLPELTTLKRELGDVKSKLDLANRNSFQQAREAMLQYLDEHCQDWREINTNDDFLAWLALPDLYSGAIRHDLLKAAFEQNNTPRVLAFFQGFLSEEAATAPRVPALEPATPATPPSPKVPLEQLAAPGRAKTPAGPTTPPVTKPVITRVQIAQFYTDVRAGKYRGKDEEKNSIEREIFEAEREGRIR